jgi:flagellar motor switch protein FliG
MSMLSRYKKKGGFEQLLTLIETCAPAKREQLIKVIQNEDPSWASLLKTKTLTMEKVLGWKAETIGEVVNEMPDRILASALQGLDEQQFSRATATMTHSKRGMIERMMAETKSTPGEIETARMKILVRVREMERDRRLDLKMIDPTVSLLDLKVA